MRQNAGNPQKPVIRIVLEINRYKPCLITSKEMIERTIERSKFCSLLNYVKSCFSRESFVSAQKFDVQAQCQSLSRKKIKICQNNTMHCVMISMTCRHLWEVIFIKYYKKVLDAWQISWKKDFAPDHQLLETLTK